MIYRHKHDESILYEVHEAEPRKNPEAEGPEYIQQYEVRRVDSPELFGSEAFFVDANEFEQTYEPVEESV